MGREGADMEHASLEQAGMAHVGSGRAERVHERLGWMLLAAGAVLGVLAAAITTFPPPYWFAEPDLRDLALVMAGWSITWAGFNAFALLVALIPYRRGERWAWYALCMVPLLWLALFALSPDRPFYLVPAGVTAAGLLLPFRMFFPGPG